MLRNVKFSKWLTALTYVFMLVSFAWAISLYTMRARAVLAPPAVIVTEEVLVVATPTPTPEPTATPTPEPLPVLATDQTPSAVNDGRSELVLTGQWFRSDSRVVLRQPDKETEFAVTAINPERTEARITIPADFWTGEYLVLLVSNEYSGDVAPTIPVQILPYVPNGPGFPCEYLVGGDWRGQYRTAGTGRFVLRHAAEGRFDLFYHEEIEGKTNWPGNGKTSIPPVGFTMRCALNFGASGVFRFTVEEADEGVELYLNSEDEPFFSCCGQPGSKSSSRQLTSTDLITLVFFQWGGWARLTTNWSFTPGPGPTATPRPTRQEVVP